MLWAVCRVALTTSSQTISWSVLKQIFHGPTFPTRFQTLGNALHHPGWPNLTITSKTDYGGTARARLGYAFGQFLPYLTGGYAWTHANVSATDGPLSETANYNGWTIGGGAEYGFTERVSVKAEYLHSEFGSHDFFSGKPYSSTSKPNSDAFRVGINFRPW